MDNVKLHGVEDFFKHFSTELSQWKAVTRDLEILLQCARTRGETLRDNRLLAILEEMEERIFDAYGINTRLEDFLNERVTNA